MSVAKVLRLDEYRDRRLHRLALARALIQGDPVRATLFEHLVEIAGLTGADRVAAVWVDEYGPGLVHPHVVLDLFSDRPRRTFAADPLHRAWECGVPGAYDQAQDRDEPSSSTIAIALGSDGSRGWFVVAESVTRRASFDHAVRDRLMFLVGECSAIVMHRDLDTIDGDPSESRFAGWQILKDLEGREENSHDQAVITRRFLVGRLLCTLVEEELTMPADRLSEQVARIRQEVEADGGEGGAVASVLDALAAVELGDVATGAIDMGELAEGADHHNGALELYRCAFSIASHTGASRLAVDAARRCGRVLRRRAIWREADRWYGIALTISERCGLHDLAAHALSGLALIKRERGNLPAAREVLDNAERLATLSGDRDTVAMVYHARMGLERQAGDVHAAMQHGWRAVNTYADEMSRTRCMAGLAGALTEVRDLQAAEDAYMVVVLTSSEHYYLVYAHDALAHVAALRGDAQSFADWASRCDALDWESGPRSAKAEILYYRGLSYQALGLRSEAQDWLERAVAFANAHSFNQLSFQAEEALGRLRSEEEAAHAVESGPIASPAVREGLRAMRADLAGVGG